MGTIVLVLLLGCLLGRFGVGIVKEVDDDDDDDDPSLQTVTLGDYIFTTTTSKKTTSLLAWGVSAG